MTFLNEGRGDRGVRMLAGIVLLAVGWALSFNAVGIAVFVIGAIALGTGIVGWCPAYSILGVSTVKTSGSHCPNCGTRHDHA